MKPRFQCGECQKEIQWGAQVCPNCGSPVEWPGEAASGHAEEVTSTGVVCPTCGTENTAEADFCASCGAKLRAQGTVARRKQQPRPAQKQGKQRAEKRDREPSNSMFSWKVISGFLGILLILLVVAIFYPSGDQQTLKPASTTPQVPAANMQLVDQMNDLEKRVAANPNDLQTLLSLANVCQDGRFFDKAIVQYRKDPRKKSQGCERQGRFGNLLF